MDRYVKCPECNRVFDLTLDLDIEELEYGHDCEVQLVLQSPLVMIASGDDNVN